MLRLFLSALFCLCLSTAIKADPFVITSGTTTVTSTAVSLFSNQQLSGSGFSMSATIVAILPIIPSNSNCPCTAGTLVNLSANTGPFDNLDFFFGSVVINGAPYTLSQGAFSMNFSAGSALVPITSDPLITLRAPFVFSTRLRFVGSPGDLVIADLSGSGTAEMTLRLFGTDLDNPRYVRQSLAYTFQTPEPTTMLLLGTGLLGVAAKVGRRRKTMTM